MPLASAHVRNKSTNKKDVSKVLQSVSFYILYYVGLHCRQNKDKRNYNIIYLNYVEGDRIIIYHI